jgi:alpha-D-xyloside xylohydrolase
MGEATHHVRAEFEPAPANTVDEALPLRVRAGSIVPMGPELQYTDEKPADPLTVWVHTGADGAFELYEDDGVTYAYERGAFATIPLRWEEASGTLTVGARTGSFPGMLAARQIRVVFVSPQAPVGHAPAPAEAASVNYDGRPVVVQTRPQARVLLLPPGPARLPASWRCPCA